jgi:hypothetical protein
MSQVAVFTEYEYYVALPLVGGLFSAGESTALQNQINLTAWRTKDER